MVMMQIMSSELRVKKLRGSGGYVMAQVSDEQQRKGNLGGPDLFLAPIGRLEPQIISKYYCNTCEKDYEGSPKIEYENPNEEVAQNLILLERGQYLCTICGSTIAEYREFQKPNQQADVGLAKPITQTFEQPAVFVPTVQPTIEPVIEPPIELEAPTFSSTTDTPSSFSSIVGMLVYDSDAKRMGVAKQVGVDSAHQVVLIVTKNNGQDETIEWGRIKKIGEIILLGEEGQSASFSSQGLRCTKCSFENKSGSKFCESCGNKL
jgi:sporulation protein YlmC with PRC-barrel domain